MVYLFRAYFCFGTGKQPADIAMVARPDQAAQQQNTGLADHIIKQNKAANSHGKHSDQGGQ